MWTDASNVAIGGFIEQKENDQWNPCFIYSKKLIPAERNYPIHERELLAIVKMCHKYEQHLKGVNVKVMTDHNPLTFLFKQDRLSPRQIRWVEFLQEFDLDIQYVAGGSTRQIRFADALSRLPQYQPTCPQCEHCKTKTAQINQEMTHNEKICTITTEIDLQSQWTDNIIEKQKEDLIGSLLFQNGVPLNEDKITKADFNKLKLESIYFTGGEKKIITYEGGRIYIPEAYRTQAIKEIHDGIEFNHGGIWRTSEEIKDRYWWPKWRTDVQRFVLTCDMCQRSKHTNMLPVGELHPLEVPEERFTNIAIDFAKVPKDKDGTDSIMVIVDHLTKLQKLIPTTTKASTTEIAKLFVKEWILTGKGIPKSIVSDRDPRFTSDLWKEICEELKINQQMATARHQNTNGLAEISIRTTKEALSRLTNYKKDNWKQILPQIENAINSSINTVTGFSPYFLAYAFQPQITITAKRTPMLKNLNEIQQKINAAKTKMKKRQQQQKKTYDKRHNTTVTLQEGQRVLLNRNGISWAPDSLRPQSLTYPWLGPYKIKKILPNDNIEIDLPTSMRIHPIFHISKVKLYKEPRSFDPERVSQPPPPTIDDEGEEQFEVEEILDTKLHYGKRKWLVRWKGYGDEENTWLDHVQMENAKETIQEFVDNNPDHPSLMKAPYTALGGV